MRILFYRLNALIHVRFTRQKRIMGEFIYAVTAAGGIILSLFTYNEQ